MTVDEISGKIKVDSSDATSAGHIFAIGDAVYVSLAVVFLHNTVHAQLHSNSNS